MPLYDFKCPGCKRKAELQVPIASRHNVACTSCGATLNLVMQAAPLIGTGRIRGDKRLIHSERQVASQLGKRWRDEGTTGKEGGAGKKIYLT